jgi:hypothetical protein
MITLQFQCTSALAARHKVHPNSAVRGTAQASDLPRRPRSVYTLGRLPSRHPPAFRVFFGLQRPSHWFCLLYEYRSFAVSPEAPTRGLASL